MKKFFMTLAVVMIAVCANAQVYLGGNVGIASLHSKLINVFCEGGFGYKHYNGADDVLSIGLKPGVELKVDKFSLVARVGFIGYTKNDNTDISAWGMDFDGNNISLGVYYNF